jgi:hypothetical protein
MKKKFFTQGITFYVSPMMYEAVLAVTDEKEIGLSELMRDLLSSYLQTVETNKLHNDLIS